ncbi:MAG: NUDIX hydrolase [Candidatus Thorarchaeota archaeon]|jgi:ADP-ribose pyrophosphatase YjhB (NUDIX family)
MTERRYPDFPIPGVGAVVVGTDGVLLARRDKEPGRGLWSLPGGGVEIGETQNDAVRREVEEETGVICEVVELIGTADVILSDSEDKVEYHYLLNHYLARALTKDIRQESPEAEVQWFTLDKLPISEMPKEVHEIILGVREMVESLMETDS